MTPPRPLPDRDGHPSDLWWPTVAVTGAALATATWVGFTAARNLLRRLP